MEEKILIKSQRYSVKKTIILLFVLGMLFTVAMLAFDIFKIDRFWDKCWDTFQEHSNGYSSYCMGCFSEGFACDACTLFIEKTKFERYVLSVIGDNILLLLVPAFMIILSVIFCLSLPKNEIIVTDKRIYGKTTFGKRFEFPIDSVVGTTHIRALKCISISTFSGKRVFFAIENVEDICSKINNHLLENK